MYLTSKVHLVLDVAGRVAGDSTSRGEIHNFPGWTRSDCLFVMRWENSQEPQLDRGAAVPGPKVQSVSKSTGMLLLLSSPYGSTGRPSLHLGLKIIGR